MIRYFIGYKIRSHIRSGYGIFHFIEKPQSIFHSLFCHKLRRNAFYFGDLLNYIDYHTAVAAGSPVWFGSHVRAVRFKHKAFKGNGFKGFYGASCVLECQNAGKADIHSQSKDLPCSFGRTGKAVHNTVHRAAFPEYFHGIFRCVP